ncbi:exodeoxyribonuclease VII large subunit [Thioalkalivibrio denitrificans]|uniref:Exodeoxyribonuclease 7 large subunit n=1 Tax=Thioalkalivibrio denitrificans TaxID=108003 RepID=A0A1V3NMP3_9GAMM|nr:exodeoxyribonuclease VII large subunit [Thioalkalivibrio denitrificans]OOG26168.1 exodeoxyribonuclease VII large subunit [Thioalkalivibrio denitrificans]
MTKTTPDRDIYTVSRLNQAVQGLLEGSFPLIWVEGELSGVARPASGHVYFTLKDPGAQVRCALFRNRAQLLRFRPADGMQVLVRARVGLYAPRGDYQLIVEHMEEAGDGALRRAFEELKQRLEKEGLFDPARKKPLPRFPRRLGVITSPTGAAIRDILSVLRRRFPGLPVLIYPVPVQGEAAAPAIAEALRTASSREDCDVLILARGGGSLEDLWAFNEEAVARALYECAIPVVSGVGHEVDVTISDLAADVRAATPSAAAELVSPLRDEWLEHVSRQSRLLAERMNRRLRDHLLRLDTLERRLRQQHPERRLRDQVQRIDELERRLLLAMDHGLRHRHARLARLTDRLGHRSPALALERLSARREQLTLRLRSAVRQRLDRLDSRLSAAARALNSVSPLATLGRGYSILTTAEGQVIRDASQVQVHDRVEARLGKGRLSCRVVQKEQDL